MQKRVRKGKSESESERRVGGGGAEKKSQKFTRHVGGFLFSRLLQSNTRTQRRGSRHHRSALMSGMNKTAALGLSPPASQPPPDDAFSTPPRPHPLPLPPPASFSHPRPPCLANEKLRGRILPPCGGARVCVRARECTQGSLPSRISPE